MVRIPEEARLCSHAPVSFAPFLGKPFKRVLPCFLPVSLCCRGRRRRCPAPTEETQTAASCRSPCLLSPRSRLIYFPRRPRDGPIVLPNTTLPSPAPSSRITGAYFADAPRFVHIATSMLRFSLSLSQHTTYNVFLVNAVSLEKKKKSPFFPVCLRE